MTEYDKYKKKLYAAYDEFVKNYDKAQKKIDMYKKASSQGFSKKSIKAEVKRSLNLHTAVFFVFARLSADDGTALLRGLFADRKAFDPALEAIFEYLESTRAWGRDEYADRKYLQLIVEYKKQRYGKKYPNNTMQDVCEIEKAVLNTECLKKDADFYAEVADQFQRQKDAITAEYPDRIEAVKTETRPEFCIEISPKLKNQRYAFPADYKQYVCTTDGYEKLVPARLNKLSESDFNDILTRSYSPCDLLGYIESRILYKLPFDEGYFPLVLHTINDVEFISEFDNKYSTAKGLREKKFILKTLISYFAYYFGLGVPQDKQKAKTLLLEQARCEYFVFLPFEVIMLARYSYERKLFGEYDRLCDFIFEQLDEQDNAGMWIGDSPRFIQTGHASYNDFTVEELRFFVQNNAGAALLTNAFDDADEDAPYGPNLKAIAIKQSFPEQYKQYAVQRQKQQEQSEKERARRAQEEERLRIQEEQLQKVKSRIADKKQPISDEQAQALEQGQITDNETALKLAEYYFEKGKSDYTYYIQAAQYFEKCWEFGDSYGLVNLCICYGNIARNKDGDSSELFAKRDALLGENKDKSCLIFTWYLLTRDVDWASNTVDTELYEQYIADTGASQYHKSRMQAAYYLCDKRFFKAIEAAKEMFTSNASEAYWETFVEKLLKDYLALFEPTPAYQVYGDNYCGQIFEFASQLSDMGITRATELMIDYDLFGPRSISSRFTPYSTDKYMALTHDVLPTRNEESGYKLLKTLIEAPECNDRIKKRYGVAYMQLRDKYGY